MFTQHEHAVIKKAYSAFKSGHRKWGAPDFGGNLTPQEMSILQPELIVSIQHAYAQAEQKSTEGAKFGLIPFTQWCVGHHDALMLHPTELHSKRQWSVFSKKLIMAIKRNDLHEINNLILNSPEETTTNWRSIVYFSALSAAVDMERLKIVEYFLPLADPKTRNSWVLQKASIKNHAVLMDMLYDLSEPLKALDALRTEHPNDYNKWKALEQRVESQRLRTVLTQQVVGNAQPTIRKM